MRRIIVLLLLCGSSFLGLYAQGGRGPGCLPPGEFAPVLVPNPKGKVTFQCDQATPMELIRAVGLQARIPIGIVMGRDLEALSKTTFSYNIRNAKAKSALTQAIKGTGYSIKEVNGVEVLLAGDLAPRQKELLQHVYAQRAIGSPRDKMVCLGLTLTNWMKQAVHPQSGFAGSCSTSPNEEQIEVHLQPNATTEEIANQIVSQGSKGMWTFKASASSSAGESSDEIDVLPYQHYTNKSIVQPCCSR